jgi:hypothetical protein
MSEYDNGEHYGEFCWCVLDYYDHVVERDEECKIHEVKEE